jgi:hypothetical protein
MSDALTDVYDKLRGRMLGAAPHLTVTKDGPGLLELTTAAIDPKTGQPAFFGAVMQKKNYVSIYLMPLYFAPELADGASPELVKRRQGKSCHNFKRVEDGLFDELGALIKRCADAKA